MGKRARLHLEQLPSVLCEIHQRNGSSCLGSASFPSRSFRLPFVRSVRRSTGTPTPRAKDGWLINRGCSEADGTLLCRRYVNLAADAATNFLARKQTKSRKWRLAPARVGRGRAAANRSQGLIIAYGASSAQNAMMACTKHPSMANPPILEKILMTDEPMQPTSGRTIPGTPPPRRATNIRIAGTAVVRKGRVRWSDSNHGWAARVRQVEAVSAWIGVVYVDSPSET